MLRLACLTLLAWMVSGCQSIFGSLLVRVSLAGDTRTQCITVYVAHGRPPLPVKRLGRDLLKIGISEDGDLTGDLTVTIQRFATEQCTDPIGEAVSKSATLARNQQGELDFSFTDGPVEDGGTDAGRDAGADAGPPADAGCDLAKCAAVPECADGPARCLSDGGCGFSLRDAGACGDGGVCTANGTCGSQCAGRDAGDACDDGLACTVADVCIDRECYGICANHGPCATDVLACAPDGGCLTMAHPLGTSCNIDPPQQCREGACVRALGFVSATLGDSITTFPYPNGAWIVAPGCEVVIDTALNPPAPIDGGWCSSGKGPTSARQDGGSLALLSATQFQLGAGATVHFVGPNPVAIVVLGDAVVSGLLSVAPTVAGRDPAGANDAVFCAEHNVGLDGTSLGGGGGAGFGSVGGRGGTSGGVGGGTSGLNTDRLTPLRGGCRGGGGVRADGGSGGGALQLSVAGALTITDGGVISASGEGGRGSATDEGAGGGGSGGALLLEARTVVVNGFVSANGGAGGQVNGFRGANGSLDSAQPATGGVGNGRGGTGGSSLMLAGGAGDDGTNGGGGGGGGVGRIRVRMRDAGCMVPPANVSGSVRADCL